LNVILCRAKNRQSAVRLPAIRRLRIATSTSSSVKSGCSAIKASSQFARFSNGEVLPPRGGHGASGIAPALKPFDRRTGADLKMFGSLELLRRFRPYVNGTPSHDHLGDIFATLDARAFQLCFVAWVAALTNTKSQQL
jgi:hypothetical protein